MDKLYKVQDIADKLGLSVQAVRSYIKQGQLRASLIGKQYIITDEALAEFIKANEGKKAGK